MVRKIYQYEDRITFASGFVIVTAYILRLVGMAEYKNVFLLVASLIAGLPIAIKAIQALRFKAFSIELLVSIAFIGALYLGEYVESSMVTFLFLIGSYLEKRSLEKTRSSIKALTDMAPQKAIRLDERGLREEIAVDDVEVGDRLLLLPGDKVPVDGKVLTGHGAVNQASITGESVPVDKEPNDYLYSSTILDSGHLEMLAEKVGDDTTFAKIIELVEEAQDSKSDAEKLIDRFAKYYTPGIILIALVVFIFSRDLHLAISFLVVACPGALVIGAPVSSVVGIGNGAKHGVLVKGGDVLERLAKVDTMVFDKTGTLTRGRPEVSNFTNYSSYPDEELIKLLARAETISEHHLGRAILDWAKERNLGYMSLDIEDSRTVKGKGIQARVGGKDILIGNLRLMEEEGIELSQDLLYEKDLEERNQATVVLASLDGKLSAIISIVDTLRDDVKDSIKYMRNMGIENFVMLTGDNIHTARAIGDQSGMDIVHSDLLPEDKLDHIKQLQGQGLKVAMTGDGVNDAPSIAIADVGIAMGKSGTDVSMETAGIVLIGDKMSQLVHAYGVSKATISNMKQNVSLALIVVAILLFGVLTKKVSMALGMLVHEGSILLVIFNAIRLRGFKIK